MALRQVVQMTDSHVSIWRARGHHLAMSCLHTRPRWRSFGSSSCAGGSLWGPPREQVAQLQLHDSKMFQTSHHGQPGLSWCVAAGTVAPKSEWHRTAATKVTVDALQEGGQGRDCTPSWLGSYASIRHAPHPGGRILMDDLWQGGAAQLLQPQPPTKAWSMLMLLCGDGVKFAFHVHWL